MTPALAALAAVLSLAALREWLAVPSGARSDRSRAGLAAERIVRRFGVAAALSEPISTRLEAAGRGSVPAGAVVAVKLGLAICALPLALAVAPSAPGRGWILVGVAVPGAAFFAPDLLLRRIARSRLDRIRTELPAVLDLMATGAEAGRGIPGLIEIGIRGAGGPVRQQLARLSASIDCGESQAAVLDGLRRRPGAGELAQLAVTMQRSRRLGSPLADGLRAQAASLREAEGRRLEERGARAAPKIQLVVALVLVPSVLLLVAAAIIAHSDSILSGL